MMDTKAKVKNEDNDDKSVKEPVEVDVLCGRGGMSNHHPGNEWYRRLIRSNRPLYRKCPKHTKLLVSKAIVQAVEQQGGRFLEKERKTGLWHVVPYKRAVDKTSQGLRERERDEEGKVSGGDKSALPEQFSGKVEASLDDLADVAIAHAQSSGLPRSASDLPKRATPAITTVPAPLTKKARIGEYQQSDNGNAQAAHALQHQQQQSGGALPVGQLMGPPLQQNHNSSSSNNNSSNRGTLAGLSNLLAAQENGSVPLPPAMQARNSSMFRLLRQPELLTCGSTWGNAGNQNSADARRLNLQRGPSSQVLTPATGMASQPSLNFFPSSHVQSAANAPGNMAMPGLSQGTSNALMMFSQNMGNNNQNLAANGLPSNAATTRQPNQPANNQPTSTVGAPGVNSKPPALTRLTTQMSDWLETFWPVQGQGGDGSAGQPAPVAAAPSNGAELQQMLMGLQNRAAGQREAASNQHKARMDAISIANIPPPQANQQPAITNVAPPNHSGRPKTSQGNQNAQQGSFQTPSDLAVPEPSDLEKAVSASLLNLASTPSKLMAGLSSFFGGGGGGLTTTAMFPPGAASLARMDTEAAAAIPPMPPSRVAAGKVSKDSLLDDHEETADEARLRNVPTTGGWPSQVRQ